MVRRNGTPGNDVLTGTQEADDIFGLAGNDSLFGLGGNDRLIAGTGNDSLLGGGGDDTLRGNEGNDSIAGGAGSDRLFGGDGDDILTGSSANAVGEIDTLTGGIGADLFVLGDANRVFYDDRNSTTAGRGDYALVTDFNTNNDVIQLKGTSNNYFLASSPGGLPAGTAIYLNKTGTEPDELIAIVQGSTSLSLDGDYFSFTDPNAAEFNLADLNGSNGFVINGVYAGDYSGVSVSNAGDINGDGFDDLIIGANGADPNGQERAGSSYVVFGKAEEFDASLNLSTLNGSNGFKINGINEYDSLGFSVSTAGDINDDGFDDLIIGLRGAASYGQDDSDDSYVVFGKAEEFDASLNLSTLNGSNGFKINGISDYTSFSGSSVSTAGDINDDGFDDLIIGAFDPEASGQATAGSSYVVFGKAEKFDASLNLSTLNGSNGFTINGINEFDSLGFSVSTAGDVNGDGFDDLIIGAYGADPNSQFAAGSSYVVFGKAEKFDASLNLSTLNGSNGFKINGINEFDGLGGSVSTAGDVNGDGFDDLIIGAYGADPNGQERAGSSYVVFGKAGGFDASLNLSTLNGSNGFKINGINELDRSGGSASTAGDINDDGFDDLIIGAPGAAPNGQRSAGESYVIFGRVDFTATALDIGTLEPFDQLLAYGNTGNAVMPKGQNLPFGSTNTADNIFFDPHNAGISTLLGGMDITQMIT